MLKNFDISPKQFLLAAALAAVTVFLTFVPLIYGAANSNGDYFTGRTHSSRHDLYTYLAWIEQGREGKILFQQLYTSEPQTANFFHPVFLIVGRIGLLLHISNLTAYFALRAFTNLIFLLIVFLLICHFLKSSSERFLAFLLVCFSAGIGAAFVDPGNFFWVYEFNTFTDIMNTALDPLGLSIVFSIFLITLKKFDYRNWKYIAIAGILAALLALIHTYEIVQLFAILLGYSLWELYFQKNRNYLINVLYVLIITVPAILWQIKILGDNAALGIWAFFQSKVETSSLVMLLIEFGFLFFLAAIGAIIVKLKKRKELALLIVWFLVGLILIYTPFFANFQRKFIIGYHVVLCVLSVIAIKYISEKFASEIKRIYKCLLICLFIVFMSMSNLLMVTTQIKEYRTDREEYYISQDKIDAVKWLKQYNTKSEVVLAEYYLSNVIPGLTGQKVFIGHYDQTIQADIKYDINYQLLNGGIELLPDSKLLKSENIKFVILDYQSEKPFLKSIYKNNDVEIYEVE